jgi:type II secretory pathway pseudopilin PulG
LIELLIVVAIILVIAAIAIPNLLRARMAANESSAASAIRTITIAEYAYSNAFPTVGYASALSNLGYTEPCVPAPTHACLLDNNIATAIPGSAGHSGYQFLATGIAANGINGDFVAAGTPLVAGQTGTVDYCSVSDATLRLQPAGGGLPVNTTAACLAYPIAR